MSRGSDRPMRAEKCFILPAKPDLATATTYAAGRRELKRIVSTTCIQIFILYLYLYVLYMYKNNTGIKGTILIQMHVLK